MEVELRGGPRDGQVVTVVLGESAQPTNPPWPPIILVGDNRVRHIYQMVSETVAEYVESRRTRE